MNRDPEWLAGEIRSLRREQAIERARVAVLEDLVAVLLTLYASRSDVHPDLKAAALRGAGKLIDPTSEAPCTED